MKHEDNKKKWFIIIPLLLIITILPLILRMKVLELSTELQPLWNGNKVVSDVFNYYKMYFLLICSILLIAGFILNIDYVKKIKWNVYILLLALYAFFTVLSTVFSKHLDIALFGFVDRYEGMLAILSYVLLTASCIIFIDKKWEVRALYKGLAISAAIIGLIGTLQYIGFDIFRIELINNIITPAKYSGLADIVYNFKPHAVYSTLQNPNYIGSYMAMLFPISIMLFIASSNKLKTVGYGLLCCVVFLSLLGSLSRTGIAGALISTVILITFYRKRIKVEKVKFISLFICLILVFTLTNYVEQFKLLEGSSQYLTDKREDKISKTEILQNIELLKDSINIKSNKSELIISLKENHLSFIDQYNKELKIKQNGETVVLDDKLYDQYKITIPAKGGVIRVGIENLEISFAYTKKAGFQVIKGNGTLAYIDYPESIGFKYNQGFASSRGYIWSKTIPLMKKTLLIGNGPDTFIAYFPHNDFVGKLNVFRTIDIIIDKPHNMYLQTGVNTGFVSLIILLSLFFTYIWNSIKLYKHCSFEAAIEIYGFCSFLAVCAYLIVGMFNDSVISVAPVFWILLGVGIAMNRKIQAKSL